MKKIWMLSLLSLLLISCERTHGVYNPHANLIRESNLVECNDFRVVTYVSEYRDSNGSRTGVQTKKVCVLSEKPFDAYMSESNSPVNEIANEVNSIANEVTDIANEMDELLSTPVFGEESK